MASHKRSHLWRTQNFLTHSARPDRLIERAGLGPDDLVVEIGAGTGELTERLAARCRRVIAIEKDEALYRVLDRRLSASSNVELHRADFRDVRLPSRPYKVFSNPPFDATAAILARLTSATLPPEDSFLVMQKEAADRFLGRPKQTLAALRLQPWFVPSVVQEFVPANFAPVPSVEVVMFRLRKRGPPLVDRRTARLYLDFVTACFTAWQPTVRGALVRVIGKGATRALLADADRAFNVRPSELAFAHWLRLFRVFARSRMSLASRVAGASARHQHQQARLDKCHRTRTG